MSNLLTLFETKILEYWWLFTLISFVTYFIVSAIYNLYFHPLSNVPGPFWCKISGWPSCYAAFSGYRHIWIWQNHQIYGDRFRYRPDGVMIASPKAYYDIYNAKANVQRSKWYEVWKRDEEDHTLDTADKAHHISRRKPLKAVFSDNALRSAEPFLIKHIDRWIELLLDNQKSKGVWATPKNLGREWIDYLVFDILGDLCFGKKFDTKEPSKIENPFRQIPRSVSKYMQFMYPIANSPFLNTWVWLKPRGINKLLEMITPEPTKEYFRFLEKAVKDRIEEEESLGKYEKQGARKDIFHYLFTAKNPDTDKPMFNRSELLGTANLLVIAGTNTTSTSLCSIFFYLLRDRRVYNKLASEIRSRFNSIDDIHSGVVLHDCRYLHACVTEGLRMTASVGSELLREVLPGGHEIDGYWYPAGTLVGTPNMAVRYHQETFKDPFVFRPERWIPSEEISFGDMVTLKQAFTPFSIESNACPGKNLALLEMSLILARMLYNCEFRHPPDDLTNCGGGRSEYGWLRRSKDHYQTTDVFMALRDGPMIQLCRKSGSGEES